IGPQAWFVRQLLPDSIPVHILVPPGSSPHAFEPGPADLVRMERSAAYLRIGHIGFELAWSEKIRGMYPDKPIFDLSDGVPLISGHQCEDGHEHAGHEHEVMGTDPHIWMSVSNARIIAENTRKALLEVMPEQREVIDYNFERMLVDIDELDLETRRIIEGSGTTSFAIFHPALSYYALEFGLEQLAIEDEGKDPSPAHMRDVMDRIKEKGVSTILVQREFNQEQARVIADEAGLEVMIIDPLSPDWLKSLKSITHAITRKP
ncbi:MAG: zinc ABC transporter substrate-binding protein, partial [Bacteroidales bacterium]|nr:zinc ABC transporter substrate-binding protein [Bacteroidales bacterium]